MKNFFLKSILSCFFIFGLFINQASSDTISDEFDSITYKIDEIAFSHGTAAQKLVDQLYLKAKQSRDSLSLIVKCIYYETLINYSQGSHDSTLIPRLETQLKRSDRAKFAFEHALLHYSLALAYVAKGYYNKAFTLSLHAREEFNALNNKFFETKAMIVLGTICVYTESFNLALNYYTQALTGVTPNQREYYQIPINIYQLFSRSGQIDMALDSLSQFLTVLERHNDLGLLTTAYLNLAATYSLKGDYPEALFYYNKTEEYLQIIDNQRLLNIFLQNLGGYYLHIGETDKAYQYFWRVHKNAIESGNLELESLTLFGLSQIYAERENTDSAYFYLTKFNSIRTQINHNSNPVDAYQAYISVALEASQNKLKITQQELALKNRRIFSITVSSIGLILLAILLFVVFQQKKKHQTLIKDAANRDLEARLAYEKHVQQLHEKQHKIELESKAREVASYSLLLSNKNNILQKISELTQQLPEATKSEMEDINYKINAIIKNNLSVDNDWEDFMLHFNKVHPRFFNNLKTFCDSLTENELRLCAYLRIGMAAKQIAQILNVSPGSIRINRYRLKKKFYLVEEDNLDNFLRNV